MPENFDYKEAPDVRMLGGDGGPEPSRRGFLFWLGLSLNVVVGTLVALPIIGYVFASFRRDKWQAWIDLVPATIDSYPKGQTRLAQYRNPAKFDVTWDGYTADIPCWVRHESNGKLTVFAINCTHLGCPVRWFPESNLFMCPCHGGVYYADGSHAAGPPPRGLYTYKIDQDALTKGRVRIMGGRLPTLQEPT
ncbi:MAG: Rieske 2Fe-2S domain-containing protein [Phycisphaerales bacterium]|nr:Rieske 2Fe-2S domain-containing protein [Phycisphaerales bacterium]